MPPRDDALNIQMWNENHEGSPLQSKQYAIEDGMDEDVHEDEREDARENGSAVIRIDRSAYHVRLIPPMSQGSFDLISSSTIAIAVIQNLYLQLRAIDQVYILVNAELPSINLDTTKKADG